MKHILYISLILGILVLQSCSKDEIISLNNSNDKYDLSYTEAEVIAKNFTSNKVASIIFPEIKNKSSELLSNFVNKEIDTIISVKQKSSTLLYNVLYKSGGFLILSADKRAQPILAYSLNNKFPINENLYPDGLKNWMHVVKKQIIELKNNNALSNKKNEKYFAFLIEPNIVLPGDPPPCETNNYSVGPLLATHWGQGCGYNEQMPLLSCGPCNHALAGCVMIAIAQTMKYFEYPNTYYWAYMNNTSGNYYTANLIRDIWDFIPNTSKTYNCSLTGVDIDYNLAYIFLGFNYSSAIQAPYNHLTVESNLNNHKPVILTGSGDVGGHAWVCDGYRRSETCTEMTDAQGNTYYTTVSYLYLHMNWGWNSEYDGYFAFNNFNPGGISFNNSVKMIYNINP